MALISAHRSGVGDNHAAENTREALERAVELDCEYVEFDVQRTNDGVFVLYHNDYIEIAGSLKRLDEINFNEFTKVATKYVKYEEALNILEGKKKAHIDFKFTSPANGYKIPIRTYEVNAVETAIGIMGAENIIITTMIDKSVKTIRTWSVGRYPDLLVGLSLGRDITDMSLRKGLRLRWSEVSPAARMNACGANLIVAEKGLAQLSLARYATKASLPLLIWTVDTEKELNAWINDSRAWLVTTNYPQEAIEIRNRTSQTHMV